MNVAAQTIKKDYLGVLRLPASFLQWLWSNRDCHVLSEINFGLLDSNIQEDFAGIIRQFETSEAYLEGLENHLDNNFNRHFDSNMMDGININEGTTFIGKLQKRIEEEMQKNDHESVPSLIELIKLYICITFLRSTIVLRMRCIAHAADSHIASGLNNVINKEEEADRKFLKSFEQPTYNTATFFACFNPSENDLIVSYVKSKGVIFQSLKDELHGKHYSLRAVRWPKYWAVMSSNPWGTIWKTKSPSDRESLYFEFESISEADNYFLIKSVKRYFWYVYMKHAASLRGSPELTGPQREWKIIKFEDGRYMMCTRKWPGKFTYMKDALLGELVAAYGDPGDSGHWILEK
ncbi:toxin CrTX-A-like [Mytilus trossulus]|uniref:toxin CrTX-A-like n=1 Tax=Mytilus trossulus TaxID=6551 RepID=UPI0030058F0C